MNLNLDDTKTACISACYYRTFAEMWGMYSLLRRAQQRFISIMPSQSALFHMYTPQKIKGTRTLILQSVENESWAIREKKQTPFSVKLYRVYNTLPFWYILPNDLAITSWSIMREPKKCTFISTKECHFTEADSSHSLNTPVIVVTTTIECPWIWPQ